METPLGTIVSFFFPLNEDDKNKYNELCSKFLNDRILIHYLSMFCIKKDNLQSIRFETYINGVRDIENDRYISGDTIPPTDMSEDFVLNYQIFDRTKKDFVNSSKKEHFSVKSYLLPSSILRKNEVKLTSKNETVEATTLDLSFIDKTSRIDDKYILCLVSSDYFTRQDDDERGKLRLKSKQDLIKSNDMFEMEKPQIFVDEIHHEIVSKITSFYPHIRKVKEDYDVELDHLVNLFALDRKIIDSIGYKYGESTESFLRRYREYNAAIEANKEANLNSAIESLRSLNPSEEKFIEKFNRKVRDIAKMIPEKNRADVTAYLASRKAALSIMEYILNKQLEVQKTSPKGKRKEKEKIIHDLLFRQHTTDTIGSNLWILNEDFIHYSGFSEYRLEDIRIDGESFLRDDLSDDEKERINSYNHNQLKKRLDILLFPREHKCIIIELKSTTADVSKHLTQVIDYAGLIRQYSKKKFEITNFYAYLIGEDFDFDTIINNNPYF